MFIDGFLLFSLLIFVRLLEEATIRSNSDRGDSVHLKIHHILSCVTWPIKYSIPSPLQVGPTCHMHFTDEFQTRLAKEDTHFVENQQQQIRIALYPSLVNRRYDDLILT